jgi:amino-acid N-acetyltransferase
MAMHVIARHPTRVAAVTLLESAALPTADLTEAHMEHFLYAGPAASPHGLVGLEFCGEDALLRSLAVAPGLRSAGLGSALVQHAETYAHERGAHAVFLLTTTAETFFARRGYAPAARESAPAAIRSTREFADICPASSAFMVKYL